MKDSHSPWHTCVKPWHVPMHQLSHGDLLHHQAATTAKKDPIAVCITKKSYGQSCALQGYTCHRAVKHGDAPGCVCAPILGCASPLPQPPRNTKVTYIVPSLGLLQPASFATMVPGQLSDVN